MITLAVAVILAAIAATSFIALTQDNRLATQVNELRSSLGLARSEAIKRNQRVTLCQSSTQASCTRNSDKWHQG